ncbi:DUF4097 family beta strand repeat-containing protein [Pseudidiomarina andamanensis]|uniref:DUF4097 domain-containing protein n=1 Tax=Pseudidiomarina andamanensis TaxID=1940690 RepID=A0AA92ES27_9GAMM|nr:DUF4097 family beta strand repeat-containing protein [Pseudidiomarina andamanensis]MDS0218747.1 DUF4097 domain-containing protein [Pseudidiomarina andamanensis]QGT95602.1 hypothetical protein D3795_05185 [Pseudidiomarina andamanensis]
MKVLNMLIGAVVIALSFAAQAQGERIDQKLDIPANARVVIDTMRGNVDIRGTSNKVAHVTGRLDKHAEKFVFELNGDTLTIKVEMPKRGNYNDNDGNELTITLPETARVEARGVSVDFKVTNFKAAVTTNTVSGDVKASKLTGNIQLESVSGDIDAKELAGELALRSVSGDVTDHGSDSSRASYSSVSGDVAVKTNASVVRVEAVSGDIELTLQRIDSLHVNSVSGDVDASLEMAREGRINVESVSGEVNMMFKGSIDADIDAKTSAGGAIHNHLTQQQAEESAFGIGQRLSLQLGERSGSMNFRTVSGDIVLKK